MYSQGGSRPRARRPVAAPPPDRYTAATKERPIYDDDFHARPTHRLGVSYLRLAAAPHALLFRRDRPIEEPARAVGVADVIRYVATARHGLRGPLALEIEGPGDPLASPETVLRALAFLHEHQPDVITGLVVDGPLFAEYVEELTEMGLGYLVVRMDATGPETARRLVDGALYRGERLDRDEAVELMLAAAPQALRIAERHDLPTMVRFTLYPAVNAHEPGPVAARARAAGARRMVIAPHVPRMGSPLAHAGVPVAEEMAEAAAAVAKVFGRPHPARRKDAILDWLAPGRLNEVDLDALDAVDVLRTLPTADEEPDPAPVLPPRRAQVVAVATRDGTMVDMPLTSAAALHVYAVTQRGIRLLGTRPLITDPRRRLDGVGDAQQFLQSVVGCGAVVATRIPARAATLLGAVGIQPIEQAGDVLAVIDRVARGTLREVGLL